MATDTEVILMALQKERDELHDKIMQVDRIIKRVKSLEYNPEPDVKPVKEITAKPVDSVKLFPQTSNIKILILRALDIINQACKLKDIQTEYNKLSGNTYNIRETIRTLHKAKLIKIMKESDAQRGYMWVKSEWIENGVLLDKYKPEGFDLLYKNGSFSFD